MRRGTLGSKFDTSASLVVNTTMGFPYLTASATSLAVPDPPGSAMMASEERTLMWFRDKSCCPRPPLYGRCVRIGSSTNGLG